MPKGLLVQPRALSRLRTDFRFCQVRTRLSGHGCTDPNRGRVTAFRVTCNQSLCTCAVYGVLFFPPCAAQFCARLAGYFC